MEKLTSRQRILAYLHAHNGVSAGELARALRVTQANIRHHLSILVLDGRVQAHGARTGQGRGRPTKIYALGAKLTGDNLAGLAHIALSEWLSAFPLDEANSALRTLAQRLAAQAIENNQYPLHITRRLALSIERLNLLHYQARWEAHAQGPRVIFEHCPYAAIVDRHLELCRMDNYLLQELLGVEITQFARLELNARGLPFCMFVAER